ncbi:hypothetical protein IJS77_05635 [bacterium]|nr:hypothetical protein [bacterium]
MDSNNRITNIKQYNEDKTDFISETNLYYDKSNNIALSVEKNLENDSSMYNGIVNKDSEISYRQYSEEYLSKISSKTFPELTETLEITATAFTNKISDYNFDDFSLAEEFVEDGVKYDLYENNTTVTIDNVKYNVTEYKSSVYDSNNEVVKTLYYKEIYDDNFVLISELTELYDDNGNLEAYESIVNYTENGIALTKQNRDENINDEIAATTTISWNPEDSIKAGDGYNGLKPIHLIGDDDEEEVDEIALRKEQLEIQEMNKRLDRIELNNEIEDLKDKLADLYAELAIAYAESFSDITHEARDYDVVLDDVKQAEAELEALKNQLNTLNSEIADLQQQIADYDNPATARDYKIDNFKQGELGDCYLLSDLKHRGDLSGTDIIKWNDDGSADVQLYKVTQDSNAAIRNDGLAAFGFEIGERQNVHLTADELKNNKININGKEYDISTGDLTVKAIRIANVRIGNDTTRGYDPIVGKAIFDGQLAYGYSAGKYGDGVLEEARTCTLLPNNSINDEYYSRTFGSTMDAKGNLKINDVNGNFIEIMNNHVYEVKYNKDNDTVNVTNPWGTKDLVYTFNKETFKSAFKISTTSQQSTIKTLWKNVFW